MPRERRDVISDLYHGALARAPGERAAFLTEACKEDDGLSNRRRWSAALGAPRQLFQTDLRPGYQHRPYDVTRDGQRFFVPTMRPGDDFRVVLDWRTLLPK